MVLVGLNAAQRYNYHTVTSALAQSFTPQGLVHLYWAELKARRKKGDESMADFGQGVARLVRLAYPSADGSTREIIGVNAFLVALLGPASDNNST